MDEEYIERSRPESSLSIEIQLGRTVNYATQQNDIPVIHSLRVKNTTDTSLQNLRVAISTEPIFTTEWETIISSINPGDTYNLGKIDLVLSHNFLFQLSERILGTVHIEVTTEEGVIARKSEKIAVLAYDEWSGLSGIPEILAAFVLPNHPTTEIILASASSLLQQWTGDSSLSGYQSKNRNRVAMIAAAIYTALQHSSIRYINPPASFEDSGQKIRTPDRVLNNKLGTCLDLAVLTTACLEQAGLNPLISFITGHAFAGVWLDDDCFPDCSTDDALRLRKRLELGEIIVFETTFITSDPPIPFEQAVNEGKRYLEVLESFRSVIDIRRSRKSLIRPLPIRTGITDSSKTTTHADKTQSEAKTPLPESFVPHISDNIPNAVVDETPTSRLDKWKRKLLDLSMNNRLLNFRETKKTLPILCPDLASLEDALADGEIFRLFPRPKDMDDSSPRDSEVHRLRTGDDAFNKLLREEFRTHRLRAGVTELEINRRLVDIYREARTSLEENGANTLYLALGFLAWYESSSSSQRRLAPIILIPLEIERKSVQEGFSINQGDDDPMINVTLLELLEHDFSLSVPGMDPIPRDDHGIDVSGILNTFRKSVKMIDRWEVVDMAYLGHFSFTKFLMWRDLEVRTEDIQRNKVVSHLINTPHETYKNDGDLPDPDSLDNTHKPNEIFCPMEADSSQLAAVCAAVEGKSFVLHGPPGTGKSQTITNLIAHALANGRSVLFVSEKMAALGVVHRRLIQSGLGAYCLQVHSNKTHKKDVIDQLGMTLDNLTSNSSENWLREASRLSILRRELNDYVCALHHIHETGENLFQGISQLISLREVNPVVLGWPKDKVFNRDNLDQLRDVVNQLEVAASASIHPGISTWFFAECEVWSPSWQKEVESGLKLLLESCRDLQHSAEAISPILGMGVGSWTERDLRALVSISQALIDSPAIPAAMMNVSDWESLRASITDWITHGIRRDDLRNKLYPKYSERLLQIIPNGLTISALEQLRDPCQKFRKSAEAIAPILGMGTGGWSECDLQVLVSISQALIDSPAIPAAMMNASDWESLRASITNWIAHGIHRDDLRNKLYPKYSKRLLQIIPNGLTISALEQLRDPCQKFRKSAEAMAPILGMGAGGWSERDLQVLVSISQALIDSPAIPDAMMNASDWESLRASITDWIAHGIRRDDLRSQIYTRYSEKLLELDLDGLAKQLQEANKVWFLPRMFGQRRVKEALSQVTQPDQQVDKAAMLKDLNTACALRDEKKYLAKVGSYAREILGQYWCDGEADWAAITQVLDTVSNLRGLTILAASGDIERASQLRQKWAVLVSEGHEQLSTDGPIGQLLRDYLDKAPVFSSAKKNLKFTLELDTQAAWGDGINANHLDIVLQDIDSACALSDEENQLAKVSVHAREILGQYWCDGEADWAAITQIRDKLSNLGSLTVSAAHGDIERASQLRQKWAVLVSEGHEQLSADCPTGRLLRDYLDKALVFTSTKRHLESTLEFDPQAAWGDTANSDHLSSVLQDIDTACTLSDEENHLIKISDHANEILGKFWHEGKVIWNDLVQMSDKTSALRKLASQVAYSDIERAAFLRRKWAELITEGSEQLSIDGPIGKLLKDYIEKARTFAKARSTMMSTLSLDTLDAWGDASKPDILGIVSSHVDRCCSHINELRSWCHWCAVRHQALKLGLQALVDAYEQKEFSPAQFISVFNRSFYQWWVDKIIDSEPVLQKFFIREFERKIRQFQEVDQRYIALTQGEIQARLAAKLPRESQAANNNSEMGILRRERQKQRRHMPIRQLFQKIPNLLPRLKPCLLMSPISVAQYLDPSHPPFDLVVFDEASQMPVWDAVGAIARGKEVVIVGDPMQLPPTNFFTRSDESEDIDDDIVEDLESILDDCLAARIPSMYLRWHYRSRHESLIAFSNYHYYDNRLLTFPSPSQQLGVTFRHINGVYDKSKSRTNRAEADAVVDEVIRRLCNPQLSRYSIGIVTFSASQQALVEDLLDEARRSNPEIEVFFNSESAPNNELVFVKNLENVQGDERDIILFSICYGPDSQGRISMNFGPLNRNGGERRLNVAITRARREVIVFSTLRSDKIDLSRTRARGVADLKSFIDYAERGPVALAEQRSMAQDAQFESIFEMKVGEALRSHGHVVHPQVGCSGYRIDLAIVDPDTPGRYLLGIECDGATYHRAKTARDRDRLREIVLKDLGWRLHRVWSTDWWDNPADALARIEVAIEEAKNANVRNEDKIFSSAPTAKVINPVPIREDHPKETRTATNSKSIQQDYELYEASSLFGDIEAFYQSKADSKLRETIEEIVRIEGPVCLDVVARLVANQWDIAKIGKKVAQRIAKLAASADVTQTRSRSRTFLWRPGDIPEHYRIFRIPANNATYRRSTEEIPPEEISNAALYILESQVSMPIDDLVTETARIFGFSKTGTTVATNIRLGIDVLLKRGEAYEQEGIISHRM